MVDYKGKRVRIMALCGASPDAICVDRHGQVVACIEIKTRSLFKSAADGDGGMPFHSIFKARVARLYMCAVFLVRQSA